MSSGRADGERRRTFNDVPRRASADRTDDVIALSRTRESGWNPTDGAPSLIVNVMFIEDYRNISWPRENAQKKKKKDLKVQKMVLLVFVILRIYEMS